MELRLNSFVDRYKDILYKAAYAYSFDEVTSINIVQEVFKNYFKHKPKLRNEKDVEKWLIREISRVSNNYSISSKKNNRMLIETDNDMQIIECKLKNLPLNIRVANFAVNFTGLKLSSLAMIFGITNKKLQENIKESLTAEDYYRFFIRLKTPINIKENMFKKESFLEKYKYIISVILLLITIVVLLILIFK